MCGGWFGGGGFVCLRFLRFGVYFLLVVCVVVWFNDGRVRGVLLERRLAYVLKPKVRRSGYDVAVSRGLGRFAFVRIDFVKEVEKPEDLEKFLGYSGFSSVDEWLKASGGNKYLYRVSVVYLYRRGWNS